MKTAFLVSLLLLLAVSTAFANSTNFISLPDIALNGPGGSFGLTSSVLISGGITSDTMTGHISSDGTVVLFNLYAPAASSLAGMTFSYGGSLVYYSTVSDGIRLFGGLSNISFNANTDTVTANFAGHEYLSQTGCCGTGPSRSVTGIFVEQLTLNSDGLSVEAWSRDTLLICRLRLLSPAASCYW